MRICFCLFVIFGNAVAQESIPLNNAHFDEDLLLEGGWQTTLTGWTVVGTAGVYNPTETQFPGDDGTRMNVAFTNNGSLVQVTGESLTPNTHYTLSLEVGRRNDMPNQPPLTLRFMAAGQVLAQSGGYAIGPGQWRQASLSLVTTDAQPIGQPLEIHLISTDTQVNYDNLSLTKEPANGGGGSATNLNAIVADTTLHVPSQYETIQAALDAIDLRPISKNAVVTIQVADGNYTEYETIVVDHPDGNRIHIQGNTTNPALCALVFQPGVNGVSVSHSRALGMINGFTLQGSDQTGIGIQAYSSGSITTGSAIIVRGFERGVQASFSSTIECAGIQATENQHGIIAIYSSSISAPTATASENTWNGFATNAGSSMSAWSSTALNNGHAGFNTWIGCTMVANDSLSQGNNYGYIASALGFSYILNSQALNNGTNFNASHGAIILQ